MLSIRSVTPQLSLPPCWREPGTSVTDPLQEEDRMTTVALLLALQMPSHVEAPPGDVGEVRRDFRRTKWVAVAGQNGITNIRNARVVFDRDDVTVAFLWGNIAFHMRFSYRLHRASGLLVVISPWVRFRETNNRLFLELDEKIVEHGIERKKTHRLLLKQLK
jgi:hypothetical protein